MFKKNQGAAILPDVISKLLCSWTQYLNRLIQLDKGLDTTFKVW